MQDEVDDIKWQQDSNTYKRGNTYFKKMYGSTSFRGGSPDKTRRFEPYLKNRSVLRGDRNQTSQNDSKERATSPEQKVVNRNLNVGIPAAAQNAITVMNKAKVENKEAIVESKSLHNRIVKMEKDIEKS